MASAKASACSVSYEADRIVLTGDQHAVHEEARRIIDRFMYSAEPVRVTIDRGQEMVLAPSRART